LPISFFNLEIHGPLDSCGPRDGGPAAPPSCAACIYDDFPASSTMLVLPTIFP